MKNMGLGIWFIVLLLVFSGCGAKGIVDDNTGSQMLAELTGVITAVGESSISIKTFDDDPYLVHLAENLRFADGVSKEFAVGNIVKVAFSGEVMQSYPMQINGLQILANDKGNQN